MTNIEQFTSLYPRLYHMAEADSWPAIQMHGLLSTKALLDLFEYKGQQRHEIATQHRPRSVAIEHPKHGIAVIRDQKPMNPKMLRQALTDMNEQQWYELLNSRCFFWPTQDRLRRFLRAYQDRPRIVITVDTRTLLECHWDNITLSRINSGAVRHVKHKRGSTTFQSIEEYLVNGRNVAELTVAYSVPDIAKLAISVVKWKGEEPLCTIWENGQLAHLR